MCYVRNSGYNMAARAYDLEFGTDTDGNGPSETDEPQRPGPGGRTRTFRALRPSEPDTVVQPVFTAQRRARIQTMLRQIRHDPRHINQIRAVQILAELCLLNNIADDNLVCTCARLLELHGDELNRIRDGNTTVEILGNHAVKARFRSIRDFSAVSQLCDDLIYLPPPVIEQDGVGGDELPPSEFVREVRDKYRF